MTQQPTVKIANADALVALRHLPDASVDAVVTDPPYGLSNTDPAHVVETLTRWASGDREYVPTGRGFMGKSWDAFVPPPAVWDETLRVLKPGGHLLAFAGSRTFDLMTLSIRFAGFDIRDSIAWLYGSGFPKSLDVSKAIDKAAGVERPREAAQRRANPSAAIVQSGFGADGWAPQTKEAQTDDVRTWQGWGTALKPAFEPIVVARKPLVGTVAANVLAHGTGALNIDATRVAHGADVNLGAVQRQSADTAGMKGLGDSGFKADHQQSMYAPGGRWPTNVVLDGHAADALDEQSGTSRSRIGKPRGAGSGDGWGMTATGAEYDDQGGASRFFPTFRYQAKAPTRERPSYERKDGAKVAHPTVKPLDLMRWLVRLVTPPGGVVLDPFAGSGATVEAALLEGVGVMAVEREADYLPLIQQRIDRARGATS